MKSVFREGGAYRSTYWPSQYRKILKISPSKYKPPKPVTQKNPQLNRPSKNKSLQGLYLKNCLQIQSKTKQKW